MTTITFPPVEKLKTLSPEKREELQQNFITYSQHLFNREIDDPKALLTRLHAEAKKNGLTPWKLKRLLLEE